MRKETGVEQIRWWHYVGIVLLSLATLLLELALTRVLSVALWYHFGFLVIATALLGFGTSGIVLALWRRVREHAALDSTLALLALLFGVLTIGCFWLMQRIPFDPFSLLADRRQLLFMPLYYVVISVPFFCAGLALALLFTRGARQVNRLYAFDLCGAGLGCVALAVVMPVFGGSGSVIMAAALGLLAAVIFGLRRARRLAIAAATLCIAAVVLMFFADRLLPISVTPNKTGLQRPPMYTAWSTFSRIDVIEQSPLPEASGRGSRRFVFDAGTAATWMIDLRPDVRAVLPQIADKRDFLSGVAYVGKARPKILIIGSGAGAQVLDGLHFGASAITAVEINPIINDTVTGRMRDFWGGLFEQPEVRLVTEEGRSFVRRSGEQYDAIIAVHTISNAAIASGALSLTENYVLTREAFADYLDHLAPDGVLFFTRPEAQIARLFATGREVLAARSSTNLATHFYAYRVPQQMGGALRLSFVAGFLMKKSPFTPAELRLMNEHLGIGQPRRRSGEGGPRELLYSPLEPHEGSIYHTLLTAPDLQAVYATQAAQIEPATDDRPFFNQHTRWSRINLNTFGDLFTQERLGRLALEDRPVAEVTLIMLLAQSILIAAMCMLLPLMRFARAGLRAPDRWRFLLYFAALGLGFIMIEMALLQHFTLFLGQLSIPLTRQSTDPQYAKFRENARWISGEVLFVTLHLVGSNNNLGRTPEGDAEYAERHAANVVWLKQAFAEAKRQAQKGLMIFTQANLYFEDHWSSGRQQSMHITPENPEFSGYSDFLAALETEVLAFDKPVVLVHGDTHYFRVDQPLFSTARKRLIEHFTRVETFGSPNVHWVRVIVDPSDPRVFTFKPEIVQKNLVKHGSP